MSMVIHESSGQYNSCDCSSRKRESTRSWFRVYDYEYDTETSLAVERFSMDSTLGEIVAEPLAVEMFNQMAPGMLEGPMIQFAYGMTLAELLGSCSC